MSDRDLSLQPRLEDVRDKQSIIHTIVMFSPEEIKNHFDDSVAEIKKQFETAKYLADAGDIIGCENIWRSQVIFIESAFDYYLHEISKCGFFNILNGKWDKTDKYDSFLIPMSEVERLIKNPESSNEISEFIISRFSREVYLSFESMRNQLNMLGIPFVEGMEKAFPKPTDKSVEYREGKDIVKDLFTRRNHIAHQLDKNHYDGAKEPISKAFVLKCIDEVDAIVSSIHSFAVEKDIE